MKPPLPNFIQPGVTGFGQGPLPPPIQVDFKAFRALCYTAAQGTEATVLSVDPSPFKTVRNFVFALLQFSKVPGAPSVFLFVNQHTPLLACAFAPALTSPHPDGSPFSFMDVPELSTTFEPFYPILKKEELEIPWIWSESELASRLPPEEIKQIAYWKPQTVGEVLFNFWD